MFRGVARSVRHYASSTKPETLGPMLLSDLLTKIDRITATNTRIKQNQEKEQTVKPVKQANAALKQAKSGKKPASKGPRQSKTFDPSAASNPQRIRVKNHPLAQNSFQLMDSSNFGNKQGREGQQRNGQRRDGQPRNHDGQRRRNDTRGHQTRGATRRPLNTRKPPTSLPTKDQTIVCKKLITTSLQPQITAETFFYGKPVSVITGNPSTGLSSVTKQFLIESNYPYNLPKHIINSIDPSRGGNKFLLQRDWSFKKIDAQSLSARINNMVKGKAVTSLVDAKAFKNKEELKRAVAINAELMKNADYSPEQKTVVFNAASGISSPKDLVAHAHWIN